MKTLLLLGTFALSVLGVKGAGAQPNAGSHASDSPMKRLDALIDDAERFDQRTHHFYTAAVTNDRKHHQVPCLTPARATSERAQRRLVMWVTHARASYRRNELTEAQRYEKNAEFYFTLVRASAETAVDCTRRLRMEGMTVVRTDVDPVMPNELFAFGPE